MIKAKYLGWEFKPALTAAIYKIASDLGLGNVIVSPQFALLVNQSVKFMPTGQGSLFLSIAGASGHLVRGTSIVGSGKVLQ